MYTGGAGCFHLRYRFLEIGGFPQPLERRGHPPRGDKQAILRTLALILKKSKTTDTYLDNKSKV